LTFREATISKQSTEVNFGAIGWKYAPRTLGLSFPEGLSVYEKQQDTNKDLLTSAYIFPPNSTYQSSKPWPYALWPTFCIGVALEMSSQSCERTLY
jgi:hypothetical protein